jgi:NAD(P)-dependent dehydrogenase (short-subunit alcohol dehydrogenase family)
MMNRVTPRSTSFDSVKSKVVVLSGGGNAIGLATVERLYGAQAIVVFGDTNEEAAGALIARLTSETPDGGELTFVKCDVREYADVYKLFRTAYDKYGHVDHAFAIAGIFERGNWFDPELTIDSVEHAEETTAVLDVNMKGTAVFARIAIVFLRSDTRKKDNRSLTLTSSVAGIRESPGLYMYQASKHGILGLMRSMRKTIHKRDGIRVNCICPGMTELLLTTSFIESFRAHGHTQTADDCARFYLGVANNPSMNGKSIYVEGGKGWEFEDGLWKTMPSWLGEEPTRMLRDNMKAMGEVKSWSALS